MILAIDPGPERSGFVLYDGRVLASGSDLNCEILLLVAGSTADDLAIEMVSSYGMAVGREVFETCVWIGRFIQGWREPELVKLIYRRDVKLELCGTVRAKDSNVRAALIDRVGKPGVKRKPGPTYGVKGHVWAALGVAVIAASNPITPPSSGDLLAGLEAA